MDLTEINREALAAIKLRCHEARIKPAELCRRAGLAYPTYWRAVKHPGKATTETLRKLETELKRVEAEVAKAG